MKEKKTKAWFLPDNILGENRLDPEKKEVLLLHSHFLLFVLVLKRKRVRNNRFSYI